MVITVNSASDTGVYLSNISFFYISTALQLLLRQQMEKDLPLDISQNRLAFEGIKSKGEQQKKNIIIDLT
jgi:hypothetical protein